MYSLYMLFALVAVWMPGARAPRGANARLDPLRRATAALLWTQYFSVLIVAPSSCCSSGALWHAGDGVSPSRGRSWWIGAIVLVAVLLVPMLPFLGEQFSANEAAGAGLGVPSQAGAGASKASEGLSVYSALTNVLWAVVGYHADATMAALAAFWPLACCSRALLVLGRLAVSRAARRRSRRRAPARAVRVGMQQPDLFELRYVAGIVPLLLLIGARGDGLTARAPAAAVACCLVVGLSVGALADQQLNGTNPRLYDFQGAVAAGPRPRRAR